jgi:tRNA dimethylallyltransferase
MPINTKPKVIIISGPTASGKSLLGVHFASALGGEIVNADSMQVYKGMDIGTAKPTIEERKGIPHHLLDVVLPDQEFNAAVYSTMALPIINEITSREKVCFVVGGTGLYIKSILHGLSQTPAANPEIRGSIMEELHSKGLSRLHKKLKKLDPDSAHRIHPNDRVRIIRALEVIYLTKRPVSEANRSHGFKTNLLVALKFCLSVSRRDLYHRINERTDVMVSSGLIQETQGLLDKGYSPDLKSMQSIGYRHMIRFLSGDWSLEKATDHLKRDTRRYAKRQLTWFRKDPEFIWAAPEDKDRMLDKMKGFLKKEN